MSTELAIYGASVPDRMRYAEALSGASLLPDSYRGKPANVLLALEYGNALGIPPMTAIQGVHIINGKPTASAGLIGALVRKAGHRLRVTGDDTRAVCEIVRGDDPEFTFRSEWTIARAQQARLTGKDTWKNFPAAMLKARAITECARDACPEALAGVNYTPEELGDDGTHEAYPMNDDGTASAPVGADEASATRTADAAPVPSSPDIEDAVLVEDSGAGNAEGEAAEPAPVTEQKRSRTRSRLDDPDGPPSENAKGLMFALMRGQTKEQALALVSSILGREVTSRADLTALDVSLVIDALKKAEAAS